MKAQLYVHARRGHAHLFTLNDPDNDEVIALLRDPVVEVLTTDGDDYVKVVGVVGVEDLAVTRDGQSLYVLH